VATVVFSDALTCFGAVTETGCTHQPTVVAGRKPKDLPEFRWINTMLGNLKTSLTGSHLRSTSESMRCDTWPLSPTVSTTDSTSARCTSASSSPQPAAGPTRSA
jgi:hypothetical protein